ncbi:MAG: CHAT domain-containing protein [Aureispira sp.]|nr:CHAT domain-containing protein [Aureispira sp.]
MLNKICIIIGIWSIGILMAKGQAAFLKSPSSAFEQFEKGETAYAQGNFKAALAAFQKASKQYKNKNKKAYVVATSMEALSMVNSGQKEKAFFVFEEAEKLYKDKEVSGLNIVGPLKICLGKYHWEYNEKDLAVPLINEVEKLLIKNPKNKIPACLKIEFYELLGEKEFNKGNYQKSLEYYEQAVAAAESMPLEARNLENLADDKMRIGEIYDKMLEPDEAVSKYQNLLEQKDDLLKDDAERISELNFRIGASFFKRKQYERSLPYLEKALELIEESGANIDRRADIFLMLAMVYKDKRLYNVAIDYNSQALEYWVTNAPNELETHYQGFLQEGFLYRKVDVKRGGAIWYQKTTVDKDWKTAIGKHDLTAIRHKTIPQKTTDYNLALLEYQFAEELISQFPSAEQVVKQIEVHMAKGALYMEVSAYAEAKSHYQNALDLMKPIYEEKHPLVAEASRSLSEIYLAEKLFSEALSFVDQAMNASLEEGAEVGEGSGIIDISQAKFPYELLNAMGTKGIILHELNEGKHTEEGLLDILESFDASQELLNQLRQTHRNEGSKYRLTELAHKFSHQAVITCDALYNLTGKKDYLFRSFDYAELTKGASLLETIRDLKARKIAGIPDSLIAKENETKVQIGYLQGEVFYELKKGKNKDAKRLMELDVAIQEQQKEHEAILAIFEKEYPIYYELKYNYTTVNVEDVQTKLKEDEVVLEYILSDSSLYILTVSKNDVNGCFVDYKASIPETLRRLIGAVKQMDGAKFMKYGYPLYELLIIPVLENIKGKSLIIVPDGELNYLPFGCLPSNLIEPKKDSLLDYRKVRYLIEDCAIAYNYSATLYTKYNEVEGLNESLKKIAIWAPDFNTMDQGILDEKLGDVANLEPLPGAAKEAKNISELFGGDVLLAADATEFDFKEKAKNYHVLHIATHGILNDKEPLYSSLVMKDKDSDDGLLHTYELYNMEISANLVVLSACNSGVGKLQKGEGVMSIARGFVHAGVPNILMTTWPVSDQATQRLMVHFYENIKAGMPKHKALQQAKIKFIKNARGIALAPYYWSGFVLAGDTNTVEPLVEESSSWLWGILGSLVAFIVFLLVVWTVLKTKGNT